MFKRENGEINLGIPADTGYPFIEFDFGNYLPDKIIFTNKNGSVENYTRDKDTKKFHIPDWCLIGLSKIEFIKG